MTTSDIPIAEAGDDRDSLERRANVVRWKLMRTLDALDKRRHEVTDIGLQVRRHRIGLVMIGGTVMLGLAAGVALWTVRAPLRAKRMRRRRWNAFGRMLTHPERLTRAQDPVLSQVVRRVATTILTALAARIVRRRLGPSVSS